MNYKNKIDWSVLSISGGLLVIFVLFSIFNSEFINNLVDVGFNFSVKYFGSFWQILMLGTFLIALFIAFSRFGDIKLGNLDKPEMNRFRWISIIMCTLLAGGGVFWAAAEPIYHFIA
ncbi:MAG: BCCT family transporter, partial [Peptostreptococcaceae bacterium]|nr:BCCT family transporter [Peptostreptococcaceae bacterium]